jgi:hypothetical protein
MQVRDIVKEKGTFARALATNTLYSPTYVLNSACLLVRNEHGALVIGLDLLH